MAATESQLVEIAQVVDAEGHKKSYASNSELISLRIFSGTPMY